MDITELEQIKCQCRHNNTIAERDNNGNIYIQCRGCKEKTKIEPKERAENEPKSNTENI